MNDSLQRKVRKLDLDKALGGRLALLRRQVGMRQIDLGTKLLVSRSLVSKIENGHRALNATEIVDYARALGIEPQSLFELVFDVIMEYDGKLPEERRAD